MQKKNILWRGYIQRRGTQTYSFVYFISSSLTFVCFPSVVLGLSCSALYCSHVFIFFPSLFVCFLFPLSTVLLRSLFIFVNLMFPRFSLHCACISCLILIFLPLPSVCSPLFPCTARIFPCFSPYLLSHFLALPSSFTVIFSLYPPLHCPPPRYRTSGEQPPIARKATQIRQTA